MRVLLFVSLVAAGLAGCARPPERPDVLLITVDTLRRDRLGVYGCERDTSPRLDAFAERGLVFMGAQSPRAKTTPAIASLLSGLYPHDHGVRDLASPLDRRVPVLAESFRAAGYETIGVIGNWVLTDERSGLARGFDTWIEDLPDQVGVPPDDVPQRRATSLTDAALALLDTSGPPAPRGERKPWFCWLHYMDPHGIYDPPAEHRVFTSEPDWLLAPEVYGSHPIHDLRLADYNVPASARTPDGRMDLAHVRDLYDAEIRYTDAEIGRLLDALDERGRFDETLVVFAADHGESLGEHFYWFEHGFYTYEVTCAVPLVIWVPDALASAGPITGERTGNVSLADLAPTILDLVGLRPLPRPHGAEVLGRSRADLVLRGRDRGDPVFSEKIERTDVSGTVQHKAVRMGRFKLIHRLARLPGGPAELTTISEELYDLEHDPFETENLVRPDVPLATDVPLDELRAELERFIAADDQLADLARLLQRQREDLEKNDPEGLRVLEALGY